MLALNTGVSPSGVREDSGPKIRATISLPQPQAGMLLRLAQDTGLAASAIAKELLCALAASPPKPANDDFESLAITALTRAISQIHPGTELRREQARMYANLMDSLQNGRIGLVEASTGVGKTRAMMCAAAQWIIDKNTSVVITAPTLALIRQCAAEWAMQSEVAEMPPMRVIFGRSEFVNVTELQKFLQSPQGVSWNTPDLRTWIADGGKAPFAGVATRWLTSALDIVAPGFPLEEIRLGPIASKADPGLVAYGEQFEATEESAEIIVCTHAMLAQHMRLRLIAAKRDEDYRAVNADLVEALRAMKAADKQGKRELWDSVEDLKQLQEVIFADSEDAGLLPSFRALLVDEAHQLEEQFSNALSEYLPLRSVLRWATEYRNAGGRLSATALRQLGEVIGEMAHAGNALRQEMVNLQSSESVACTIRAAIARLATHLESISIPRDAENPARYLAALRLRRALGVLRLASKHAGSRSFMRFSPVRSFPQLYIGRSSVENVLSLLWSIVDAGAAVSATLYFGGGASPSAFYQRTLLAIPADRVAEYPPIEATWLTHPVQTLWLPDKDLGARLRPPSKSDRFASETEREAAEEQWIEALAPYLARIHANAAGGVLVLMTSYRAIELLTKRFATHQPGIPIVAASSSSPLMQQRARYLRLKYDGMRPLWLALGGAWTGLDVGGHDPWRELFGEALASDQDNVLSTLVIPRLPFGTNQTITHLWRKNQKPGTPWELYEAAFRFKQGLGRLVRRPGLPTNREIYVLDGRLADPAFAMTAPIFERIMAKYQVRRTTA